MLIDITSLSNQINKVKNKIDKNNPKMQIFLSKEDNMKLLFNNYRSKNESQVNNNTNNSGKFINIDSDIKVLLISILINILIKPERGTLNSRYCDQFPYDNNKPNYLFHLHQLLNIESNKFILPKVTSLFKK